MKTFVYLFFSITLFSFSLFSQTTITPGNVNGIWTKAGNPYLITGEINIQNNNTLTIEPGVIVRFEGNYKLNVYGRLLAIGAVNDTILFMPQDTSVGWHGIRFLNSNTNLMDSSKLILCKFMNGKALGSTNADQRGGAIYCEQSSDILIEKCVFMNNYAALDGGAAAFINNSAVAVDSCIFKYNDCYFYGGCIYIQASNSKIRNSVFDSNHATFFGAAITGWDGSVFLVENCKILNNTSGAVTGIYTAMNCLPYIVNTLFANNSNTLGNGGACGFSVSTPTLINVTVVNNIATQSGGGIWIYNSTATIKNAIIYNNTPDQLSVTGSTTDVTYSNIMGGYTGTGNISIAPQFTGSGLNPYSLEESSPCRNAGTPDTTGLNLPISDLAGNIRISEGIIDMGSYEIQGVIPVDLVSFNFTAKGNSVNLSWLTISEKNNKGFEIQRSYNGYDYESIDFINGKGTTTEVNYYSYIDAGLNCGTYNYRLKQIDLDGTFKFSNTLNIEIETPDAYLLLQNYPNPFNPNTVISWQSPLGSHQTIKVFDVLGNEIATLVDEYKPAGSYEVEFDGNRLASGIYFYQLRAGEYTSVKKMILIK